MKQKRLKLAGHVGFVVPTDGIVAVMHVTSRPSLSATLLVYNQVGEVLARPKG
ncbi:MAG: hypothetical protein LBI13_01980 [Streptococcaceae bacterium]|nr:hypothetical protein [Streptococcaceae bacterium]